MKIEERDKEIIVNLAENMKNALREQGDLYKKIQYKIHRIFGDLLLVDKFSEPMGHTEAIRKALHEIEDLILSGIYQCIMKSGGANTIEWILKKDDNNDKPHPNQGNSA